MAGTATFSVAQCLLLVGFSLLTLSRKVQSTITPSQVLASESFAQSTPSSARLRSSGAPVHNRPYFWELRVRTTHSLVPICNVVDYGASGDGVTYDTAAIQKAVDACSLQGAKANISSLVVFPANHSKGLYLTATVIIHSYVTLNIEAGAQILAGTRREDYGADFNIWYCLLFWNATQVGITGPGTFNGQSAKFVLEENPIENVMVNWNKTAGCTGVQCRPRMIGFLNCSHIEITDLLIYHSPFWTLHLVGSEWIQIDNLTVHGDWLTPQSDGIDIHNSAHVRITHCDINTADDSICPKTNTGPWYGYMGPSGTHDVFVQDCRIRSKSGAIKFGSSTYLNFTNLVFDRIHIRESHRGLAVQLRDAGNISNVVFSNIVVETQNYHPIWWGAAEPIYLTAVPRHVNHTVGSVFDVKFINISIHSEGPIFLAGSQDAPGVPPGLQRVRDITLQNVTVEVDHWSEWMGGLRDLRPSWPTSQQLLYAHTNIMHAEYAQDVTLQQCSLSWGSGDPEQGLSTFGHTLDTVRGTVDGLRFLDVEMINP